MKKIWNHRCTAKPKCAKKCGRLMTYLANTNEATSRQIEMGTSLRQPEVSTAMRTLRQNNWIDERDVKPREGSAHENIQAPRTNSGDIQHYEEEKNSEAAETMQAIQRLKELAALDQKPTIAFNYF